MFLCKSFKFNLNLKSGRQLKRPKKANTTHFSPRAFWWDHIYSDPSSGMSVKRCSLQGVRLGISNIANYNSSMIKNVFRGGVKKSIEYFLCFYEQDMCRSSCLKYGGFFAYEVLALTPKSMNCHWMQVIWSLVRKNINIKWKTAMIREKKYVLNGH